MTCLIVFNVCRHLLLIHGIRRPDPDMYCADLDMEFDQDMQEWNQEEIERYCKTFKKEHKKIRLQEKYL